MSSLEQKVNATTNTVGEYAGGFAGAIVGNHFGPAVLGNYITGTTAGYANAAIAGRLSRSCSWDVLLGYTALNTAYKLTRDTINNLQCNKAIRHPIGSVKRLGSNIKSLLARPYKILTRPLGYMLKPAFIRN